MNHYPHHIGDFNSATRYLTRLERSIYRDMIDMYYDTEAPLILDTDLLKRKLVARSQEEKNAVDDVLKEFFIKTDSGYFNARCDVEITKYSANKSLKAEAGKASAIKREQDKAARLAELNRTQGEGQHNSTDVEQVLDSCSTEMEQTSNCTPTNQNQNQNHKPLRAEKHVNEDVHATVSKPEKFKDEIQNVFEHWKMVMGKRDTVILDSKRKSAIRARLADGYTQDMLCKAVDGCSMTDHNMGRTATNKTLYNDIEFICRNAPNVDRFMDIAGQANDGPTQDHEDVVQVNIQDLPRPKPAVEPSKVATREETIAAIQAARDAMK